MKRRENLVLRSSEWGRARQALRWIALVSVPLTAFAETTGSWYLVKEGETLGEILHRLGLHGLWGKSGLVAKTVSLNASSIKEHGALIHPNSRILLPVEGAVALGQPAPPRATPAIPSAPAPAVVPVCAVPPTPELARTPATDAETPSASPEFQEHSSYHLSPIISFSKLSAVDASTRASAVLGSGTNYGAALDWSQSWSERFRSALRFSGEHVSYSTRSASHSLENSSFFTSDIGASAEYSLSGDHRLTFGLGIGLHSSPFLRSQSLTALAIDTVSIPEAGASFSMNLFRSQTFEFDFGLGVKYLSSATADTYQVRSGVAYGAWVGLSQPRSGWSNGGGLFFEQRNQDTSIVNQSTSELGAFLRFGFDLMDKAGK